MTNQEAISVLESISAKTDYYLINDDARSEAIDMAISALADRWETKNVGDMISRQDTIDALKEFEAQCWEDACFKPLMSDARNIIGDMPSAEPEIIHCKDCINADYSGLGTERLYCMDLGVIMHSDDYCSRAERRTDE